MAVAVAAIKALTNVVVRSEAQTMMGLEKDLKEAAASLIRFSSGRLIWGADLPSICLARKPAAVICPQVQ